MACNEYCDLECKSERNAYITVQDQMKIVSNLQKLTSECNLYRKKKKSFLMEVSNAANNNLLRGMKQLT